MSDASPTNAAAQHAFRQHLQQLLNRQAPEWFTCPSCNSQLRWKRLKEFKASCLFTQFPLHRFQCNQCGLIFGPLPLIQCAPQQLSRLYELLYEFFSEGASTRFQEKTFYLMNPSIQGHYLNYACGDWQVGIQRLRTLGWNVWGFEPFQSVQTEAIVSDIAQLSIQQFDGIMSHNYLEHVQNPATFFCQCKMLLKPAAVMYHSTPCYEYKYEVSPLHLYFFVGDSIDRLAQHTGFRKIAEYRSDLTVPGNEYICVGFAPRA